VISPTWPAPDEARIAEIATEGHTVESLREQSPVKLAPGVRHTDAILDTLFPGDPLLCLAIDKHRSQTKAREGWRGQADSYQFIVPSEMAAVTQIPRCRV
jgi:hypothetical protein